MKIKIINLHLNIMKYTLLAILCFLFLPATAIGQNLTGHWTGGLYQDDKSFIFKLEADIIQRGNRLSGRSKIVSKAGDWVIEYFEGEIVGKEVRIAEKKVVHDSAPENWSWCIKNYLGAVRVSAKNISLVGSWTSTGTYSKGVYSKESCVPGRFVLSKQLLISKPMRPSRAPRAPSTTRPPTTMSNAKLNTEITLKNVIFELSTTVFLPSSLPELSQLVKLLNTQNTLHIRIDGHTDKIGDSNKNLILSQQRALVIKEFLVQQGIAESRIKTNGYGDTQIICATPCEANRRVEFTLSK